MKNLQRGNIQPITIGVITLLIIGIGVYAYQTKKEPAPISPVYTEMQSKERMKQQANEMTQALISRDFEKFATFAYPKVIDVLGGKEKYMQIMKDSVQDGVILSSVSIGEPSTIVDTGTELQAVLPQTLEIKIPTGVLISKGSLIALSSDKGTTWHFLDTGGNSLERMRMQLPNLSTQLVIPSLDKPVFYKK